MSRYPSLTETAVREALHHNKGEDAQLVSWDIEDFLGQGSNYVSTVTSVKVKYSQSEENREVTYIVKLKRKRQGGSPSYFDNMTFDKEIGFLTKVCPLLNAELLAAGLTPLQVPRCCHSTQIKDQDYLFLEDLRPRGFKLRDRQKYLDESHTKLVLHELAKLHAASYLLCKKTEGDITDKYEFLKWEWQNYSEEARTEFRTLLRGAMNSTSTLASLMEFPSVSEWYKNIANRNVEVVDEQLERSSFDVIGHGDVSINNLMFRYNDQEQPVEVILIDFQICRRSSLAIDLNYFFSSLSRSNRKNIDESLSVYHSTFKEVMSAAKSNMPFTKEEICQEFKKRQFYGFIYSAILIPILVSEPKDVLDFDSASDGRAKDFVEELRQNAVRMLAENPLLRPRMQGLFEDIIEYLDLQHSQ